MDSRLKEASEHYNRSLPQTVFLFELCGSYERYVALEEQIKKHHVHFCPADNEAVNYILNL